MASHCLHDALAAVPRLQLQDALLESEVLLPIAVPVVLQLQGVSDLLPMVRMPCQLRVRGGHFLQALLERFNFACQALPFHLQTVTLVLEGRDGQSQLLALSQHRRAGLATLHAAAQLVHLLLQSLCMASPAFAVFLEPLADLAAAAPPNLRSSSGIRQLGAESRQLLGFGAQLGLNRHVQCTAHLCFGALPRQHPSDDRADEHRSRPSVADDGQLFLVEICLAAEIFDLLAHLVKAQPAGCSLGSPEQLCQSRRPRLLGLELRLQAPRGLRPQLQRVALALQLLAAAAQPGL
mmetsp:Transcript_69482/g.165665  ORF Transcript_69482/g.165665 Transcript_69482/m.165665 type:complete len:293 (-) Transcript_69482:420-1298(-)